MSTNGRCVSDRMFAENPENDRWLYRARTSAHNVDACKALWAAVVSSAVEDLTCSHDHLADAAADWLRQHSGSFEWVCDQMGLDPTAIRERLFGSDDRALVSMRGRLVGMRKLDRRDGAAS